jgi:hypothetical protein
MQQSRPTLPSNTGLQRTALCARKIGAFLKVRIGSKPLPIYQCAAADAQAVGRQPIILVRIFNVI